MSNLILPQKWTRQPQVPVEIDWSNPITNRIISVQDARGVDHVTGMGTFTGSARVKKYSPMGQGVLFGADTLTFPLAPYSGTINDSLVWVGSRSLVGWAAYGTNNGLGLTTNGSNLGIANEHATYAMPNTSWPTGIVVAIGVISGQYSGSLWLNGIRQSASRWLAPATQNVSSMGGASDVTGLLSIRYARQLNDSEVASLSANPWQIFKAQQRRIFVASAGGGTTLAITGQEVTAGLGTILPDINYSLGGQSVTTSVGALVANLNVAITGQVLPVSLGSQVASISTGLAGQAVPLSLGTITVFSSGAVSLAITGQSTMISLGSFIPNTSYSLSGQNISASINNLTSDIMYTLSGQSTPIVLGTVAASVNSTLVGQPVSLTLGSTSASISTVLNGQSLVLAQSSLSPVITSSITGQSITASLGTVTPVGGTTPQYSKNSNLYYNIGNDLSIMLGSPTITTWNNSGRPTGVKVGTFGFNTETNKLEVYTGSGWIGVLLT